MKPRLLDLFCGAGGASVGYHRAGFEVVGVDLAPQPNYPFRFVRADAMTYPLEGFDVIHASPPCQAYTVYAARSTKQHPELIGAMRDRLIKAGVPYVIENVEGAPLINAVLLCGSSFPELRVKRHRLFESNILMHGSTCFHTRHPADIFIMNRGWKKTRFVPVYGSTGCKAKHLWKSAMGIDWMTWRELAEAIPPQYSEHIGAQILATIGSFEVVP